MNYLLIIYLIGVFYNCCYNIYYLIKKYNDGFTITVGMLLKTVFISLLSWAAALPMLIGYLCYYIYRFLNIPIFKNKDYGI